MGGKLCGTFLIIQPFSQLPQRLTQGQAHQIAPGAAHHIGNEIGDVAGAVKKGLQQLNGGAADGSLQQCQKKALSCAVRHQDAKRQKEETRYKDYYGDDGKPHPKEYITYTFNADTLDNDDIISMLDKPTYKRKVDFLKSINTRETQVSRSISSGTGDAEIPQTISFSQDD